MKTGKILLKNSDFVGKAGFSLKGFTFSGEKPDSTLSVDGKSINVAGLKWFPKDDYLMFNSESINFAQKVRGRKVGSKIGLPENLTMRDWQVNTNNSRI